MLSPDPRESLAVTEMETSVGPAASASDATGAGGVSSRSLAGSGTGAGTGAGKSAPCLAPRVFFMRLPDLTSYGANRPLRTTACSADDAARARSTWTTSRLRSLRRKRGMAAVMSVGEDEDDGGSSTGLGLGSDERSSPALLDASRLGAGAGAALNKRRRLRARKALGVPSSSSSSTPAEPDGACMSSQLRGLFAGLEPGTGTIAADFCASCWCGGGRRVRADGPGLEPGLGSARRWEDGERVGVVVVRAYETCACARLEAPTRTYGPAARRDFRMAVFSRGASSRSASASSVSDSDDEGAAEGVFLVVVVVIVLVLGFWVGVGVAVRWTLRRVERLRVFMCECETGESVAGEATREPEPGGEGISIAMMAVAGVLVLLLLRLIDMDGITGLRHDGNEKMSADEYTNERKKEEIGHDMEGEGVAAAVRVCVWPQVRTRICATAGVPN